MATKDKDSVLQQLREFEREATSERRDARELREDAVGLLTPALLRKHIRAGTDLVLAYGRKGHTVEFTVDDLKRFVEANTRAQKTFRRDVRGVPLLQLEKASAPDDVRRSRNVRSATLYKVNKNLLFFSVTGNSKPHYQVRVRLEDWDMALHSPYANALTAARTVATGRISFDCSCGRHQYWYRYLSNIGGFDVNPPKEQDFPKIRNPGLKGCCCKHVLKVLRVLKSNTIHAFLAGEIDRQASTVGFADTVRARFLKANEVRQVSAARGVSRNTKEGRQAYRRFLREAQEFIRGAKEKKAVREMQGKLRPRGKPSKSPPVAPQDSGRRRALIENLRNLTVAVKFKLPGFNLKTGMENLSQKYGLSADELKAIMKQEGIS